MRNTTNLIRQADVCRLFVFMVLQIAFPISPLFLERSALPPGCTLCVPNPALGCACDLLGSMFSAACGLYCALGALFAHACLCFQPLTDSFAKCPGVGVVSADEGAAADAPLADGDACGTAGQAAAEHFGADFVVDCNSEKRT